MKPPAAAGTRERKDRQPQDAFSVTHRTLTSAYLFALALVASLTIAGGVLISSKLSDMEDDATVIHLAGSQRMLTQRIAALATDLQATDDAARQHARSSIDAALRKMRDTHASLSAQPDSAAYRTPELHSRYFDPTTGLHQQVTSFIDLGTRLTNAAGEPEGSPPQQIDAIRAIAFGTLMSSLSEAIMLHENAKRSMLASALRIHHIIIALAIIVIVLEGFLIFRPMALKAARQAAALERDAHIDGLTGLLNRRAITQALSDTIKSGEPVAVLAIDLDHFKEANDAEGHQGGDALLRATAERLRRSVRPNDIVGRIGGDEFAAFLIGVSDDETAAGIVERVRAALHHPVEYDGRRLRLGATLGVAIAPIDSGEPEVILRLADEALVRAKAAQRGSVGRACRKDAERLLRATAIVKAFDASEADGSNEALDAYFQPIVPLGAPASAGAPVCFEVLARWNHPDLGAVPPSELLEAIGPGRTYRLGHEVRSLALNGFKSLLGPQTTDLRLALNLSASEVAREDIGVAIAQQVSDAGVPLSLIEIEITEEVLLDRVSDRTLEQLAALRGRGAKLVLDDFGTGNSGLSQLLRLPLDAIKLDKRFIQQLGVNRRAEEIVRATVSLAKGLDLEVVAEGIETEEQEALAMRLGCDRAQGYLYARPMPMQMVQEWLARRSHSADILMLKHKRRSAS